MSKRDQAKICKEEWFKDHKATVLAGMAGDTTIIEWKKPTSWNYGCRFIIHSQWLIVVGDLGEATYQWGQAIDMKFLSSINFDYFWGKCRASPVGRQFRMWDPRTMKAEVERFKEEANANEKKFLEEVSIGGVDKDEFDNLLHHAYDAGRVDSDFAAMVSECGYIPDCMCVGHWVGLQMAIDQLKQQEHTPPTPT